MPSSGRPGEGDWPGGIGWLAVHLVLLLISVALATTFDLEPGWVAEQWTVSDGLPSDTIFAVARDPTGGLLLGTGDGLVWFDGREFTVLHAGDPGGPPDNRVVSLSDDGTGGIWVITEAAAVQHRTAAGIRDYGVLAPVTRPVRWTSDLTPPLVFTGLGVYELRDPPVLRADLAPDIVSMLVDEQGILLDSGHGHLSASSLEGPWVAPDPASAGARYVASDVARRHSSRYAFEAAGVVRNGRVLLPLGWPALAVLELGQETWVATGGAGLLRIRPTPLRVHAPPPGIPGASQVVRDVLTGAIWASGGLSARWWSVEGPTPHFQRVELDGRLWETNDKADLFPVSSRTARWWWSMEGMRPQQSGDDADVLVLGAPVTPPCESTLQALWTLPGGGRATALGDVLENGEWRSRTPRCDNQLRGTRAAVSLPGRGMLLGGFRGLVLLPDDGSAPVPLAGPARLSVRHLRVEDGRVWMATELDGLCTLEVERLDAGGWRCVGNGNGLGVSVAHASFADALGRTWVATNRGLRVAETAALDAFARGDRTEVPFVSLGPEWGLLKPELNGFAGFSGLEGDDGHLWFPAAGGVVEVRPDELQVPSALVARAVPPLPAALPVDAAPVEARLVVEPLDWAPLVQLRYRVGNRPWTTTEPDLHLGSLPPGDSMIEVEGRLLGDWLPLLSTTITREPRLTERATFPLLVLLGVMAILVLAAAARNRALAARQRALAAEVERQTAALAERNRQLAEQAVALTVQNETISQQASRLLEVDELKRKLIADLAHELRTPLTLVMGALGQPSPDVPTATRNATRLKTLLDELFDLSRLETGTLRLRVRQLDLRALVGALVDRFRLAFQSAGRELEVILPDAPVPAWGDAHLLEKVIGNLVINALRHGAGRTEVLLRTQEGSACLEVADGGPGIPVADRARVFERFVQLSTGDTRERDGAGIGLSLARELVELHGGDIHVEDRARFCVRLPLGQAHVALDDVDLEWAPPEPAAGLQRPPVAPDRPQVLLVEDNDELRAFIAGLLRVRWTVAEARDGREGLEAVRRLRPLVVVSDVRMPRLDGLGMGRAMRADPAVAATPVLLVSAKTQEEDRVAGLELAQDYLCKPFGAAELMARTENLLRAGAPEAAAPARPEHEARFLDALAAAVAANLGDPEFSAADLARKLGMSQRVLQVRMKELDLPAPVTWLLEARLREAQSLLRAGRFQTVSEVASAVGLSRAYFTRAYAAWAGQPPGRVARDG